MIEKEPFRSYTLEEDKDDKRITLNISLNQEEQSWLKEIKEDLNIKQDGKALKTAAFVGKNVLQGMLTRRMLKYLFKNGRAKLED